MSNALQAHLETLPFIRQLFDLIPDFIDNVIILYQKPEYPIPPIKPEILTDLSETDVWFYREESHTRFFVIDDKFSIKEVPYSEKTKVYGMPVVRKEGEYLTNYVNENTKYIIGFYANFLYNLRKGMAKIVVNDLKEEWYYGIFFFKNFNLY